MKILSLSIETDERWSLIPSVKKIIPPLAISSYTCYLT
jgi:hypothetical protein